MFVSGFLLGFSGNSQLDSLLAVGILSMSIFYISLVLMFTINTVFFFSIEFVNIATRHTTVNAN